MKFPDHATRLRIGAAVLLLSFASPTGAEADSNLNCDAYAGAAVAQNQQNENLGCGFGGAAWSSDFNAHRQWCRAPGTKMESLTAEDKARSAALAQCGAKPKLDQAACATFAKKAVMAADAAAKRKCGFGGGRWTADYGSHFNWCLSASQPARDQEDQARANQLQGCLDAQATAAEQSKKDACAKYAATAVAQQSENVSRKCNFTGGRWSDKWQGHFDYCLGARADPASKEAAARVTALAKDCMMRVCTTRDEVSIVPPFFKSVTSCRNVPKPKS